MTELTAQDIRNNPRVAELDAQIERARRQAKNKENRWTGNATPFPEEVGKEPFTEDEVKTMKEERRNLDVQERQRVQEKEAQRQKLVQLDKQKAGIGSDVSVEREQEHREKLVSLENDLNRRSETGNEFANRRNRILEQQAELQERINRTTEGRPEERERLMNQASRGTNAALRDVDIDQKRDQAHFMSSLRHQAHGTGRVGAIEDEARSRQQEIVNRYEASGKTDDDKRALNEASRLNLQKAESDRVQLEHQTRNRAQPEFSGIEEFSKKLQLSVLGGEDKKIQESIDKATNESAKELKEKLPELIRAVKANNVVAK